MIRVSLRDWIVTGELGPFTHGSTKAALLRRVGHPTDSGCPDLGQDAVWRYGDIELLFLVSRDAPAVLFSVSIHSFNHVPDGGRDVRIDPWIVRMSMPPGKLRGGLASLGVRFREEPDKYDEAAMHMILRDDPFMDIHFIPDRHEPSQPLGLWGLWSRKTM